MSKRNEEEPLQQIREIREGHAAKHEYDLSTIAADIVKDREMLAEEGWKLVKPKRKINTSWELSEVVTSHHC